MARTSDVNWEEAKKALVRSVQDPGAFGAVVTAVKVYLFAIAYKILRNEAEALDAVQEVFLILWEKRKQFEPDQSLKPWLATIMRNHAISRQRKIVRDSPLDDPTQVAAPPPMTYTHGISDEKWDWAGISPDVWKRAWDQLSPKEQEVLTTYYIEEVGDYQTCADCLCISVGSFTMRLHRARTHLRELIEKVLGHEI